MGSSVAYHSSMSALREIRELAPGDVPGIVAAFASLGWHKPASLYARYLDEQSAGTRDALIALVDGAFAGYVTVNWRSSYAPFRDAGIPEIQDFNVLPERRRNGIGSALLDEAEKRIARRAKVAGIGVGLDPDYGAAQRLYVRRGYVPDGRGVTWRYETLRHGDRMRVDDDSALWLTRDLRRGPA